jgi:hypothetical protein
MLRLDKIGYLIIKQQARIEVRHLCFCERLRVSTPRHASLPQAIPSKP